VRLAARDAAGFGEGFGEDCGLDFVGFFGDGAEDFGFGFGCWFWCDLMGNVVSLITIVFLELAKRARTVIVLDLVKAEVTVFVLVVKSVTIWVDVEFTIGVVVAEMEIVGVTLDALA
jgi:hypothetical protein